MNNRIDYIDGLKGISTLIVFVDILLEFLHA